MLVDVLKKATCLTWFIVKYFLVEIFYFIFRCRPKKDIKGQHVLITGSAQGIGAMFALKFAEIGNTVHCVDIMEDLNNKMVEGLKMKGLSAFAYTCDITNWESLSNLKQEITEKVTSFADFPDEIFLCQKSSQRSLEFIYF